MSYQLIEPDGTPGEIHRGETGRAFVMRYCRFNPGWTWRPLDAEEE